MRLLTSLFFYYVVNVRFKINLSIENFYFFENNGFNQILLGEHVC